MNQMLFRKNMEKLCLYCSHAARVDENTMVCTKKGLVDGHSHCRGFRYDPLKRVPDPPAQMHLPEYDSGDYSL